MDAVGSNAAALMAKLPELFVSLHDVLEDVATANDVDYRTAAHLLLVKLESEPDFPPWYRYMRPKSAGVPDPANGADWGKKLLEHAGLLGTPVVYPHDFYAINGYDLPSMPAISVYHFLYHGPTLGFRRNEICAFLARSGIAHGLGDTDSSIVVQEGRAAQKKARERHGNLVLQALQARKVDPMKLDPPLGNKPWPLREELRAELKLTPVQIQKAFTWLRAEGLMKKPLTGNPAPK